MRDNPKDRCVRKRKKLGDKLDLKDQLSQGEKMINPRAQSLTRTLSISSKDNSAELKNKSSRNKLSLVNNLKRGSLDTKRHLKIKLQLLLLEIHSHILLKIKVDVQLLVYSMNRNRGANSQNRDPLMTKAKLQARQRESNFQHIVN